jgi:hypothetical protein
MTTYEKIKDQLKEVPVSQKTERLIKQVRDLGIKFAYGWSDRFKKGECGFQDYSSNFVFEKEYNFSVIRVEIFYLKSNNRTYFKVFTTLRNPTLKTYTKIHAKLMELYELN